VTLKIERRSFLKTLGAGFALMAVSPTKLLAMLPKPNSGPFVFISDWHYGIDSIDMEFHLRKILTTEFGERIDQDLLMTMGDTFHETLFSKNAVTD